MIDNNLRACQIYVDYLRKSAKRATAIAPYSTRARPNAPVSMPIAWLELTETLGPAQFTVGNLQRRLKRLKKDLWADMLTDPQNLASVGKVRSRH